MYGVRILSLMEAHEKPQMPPSAHWVDQVREGPVPGKIDNGGASRNLSFQGTAPCVPTNKSIANREEHLAIVETPPVRSFTKAHP